MRTEQKANNGFTLIEVILALGLTSLLLGLLSTSVFIVASDWNRNSRNLDDNLDEALAVLQIDRALHGAFPHSFTNEETLSRQIFFTGEKDYLAWVSTISPQRSPGLTTWELYSVSGEGVYLGLVPAYSDNPSVRLEQSSPTLLFPDYDIEFNYLYEELEEDKVWTDQWEAQELLSLPLAVHMRLIPYDPYLESIEVLARLRNNEHRSIRPNDLERLDL